MFGPVLEILALGGPVVWILALFSVIALTVVLVKAIQFWSMRDGGNAVAEQAINHFANGEHSQALVLVKGRRAPRPQLIAQTLLLIEAGKLQGEALHKEVMRQARQAVAGLASYLRVLEVIATLAPLLGLLGTVLGMIQAFQAMEAAGTQVDPSVLSGGIWVALLTTAVGLAVAIPVSLLNSWFERRVEAQAGVIQNDLEHLLSLQAARVNAQADAKARLKLA
ncbi:outer membrane transport energization protein ExbB [Halopseudomonas xinjiangensis]|uniref:Outer membrane transport energization protein ExbB n=1 Tax=Halopseudomonas xinjiangensis TaxID=487184 RepID=A0A1H1Q1H9_9GAMM|nr:MotA/TolQ/ExbB proton channel family protein [Halopseudomonas xinjiangensis]SDS17264.1 outer membrane transport energization protein ExbB [Halopseudomonas xinjiangensis]